jgi:hypothetical protein
MALNGMGVTESIVHAKRSPAAGYVYRNDMGMVPSAEFAVFFDDFLGFNAATSYAPAGWTTILNTGATVLPVVTAALGSTGVIALTDATASEGAAIHQLTAAAVGPVQLTVGKRAYFEFRVYTNDITDNTFFMGLTKGTDITLPADLYDTSTDDLIAVGIADGGSGAIKVLSDTANAGITTSTTTGTWVASTWTVLALAWDGVSKVRAYKDGTEIAAVSTTIPTGVTLSPFVSAVNGDGAGAALSYVDYVRYAIER